MAYSDASRLLGNISTTTWGSWLPGQTAVTANDTADPFGVAAWQKIWVDARIANYTTTGIYNTTVRPTSIPTSSLVYPPKNYFGPSDCYDLPEDFIFGAASAAGQIEGAMGMEGKTPDTMNLWLLRNDTTDQNNYVTIENYFLYKQDIARMAAIGLKYFHFTMSWSRVLPFGVPGSPVNQQAIDHYDDVINTILEYGMKPIVSIMHFDTPYVYVAEDLENETIPVQHKQSFYNYNAGMQNSTWATGFVNYGKIVLAHYSDRVPIWISTATPWLFAYNDTGVRNIVTAHADLYHFYKDELKGTGQFGQKIGVAFPAPKDPLNATHVEASQRFYDLYMGVLSDPWYLGQQYPEAYTSTIANVTLFTEEELKWIGGTADFYGVDAYTAQVVSPPPNGIDACQKNSSDPYWPYCVVQESIASTGWALGAQGPDAEMVTPALAIREGLNYLWNKYKVPVLIAEFGLVQPGEIDNTLPYRLYDSDRSDYYLSYLSEMLKAMFEDGVNVMGALAWSAFDSWEVG